MSMLKVSNKKELVKQRNEVRNAQEEEKAASYASLLEEQLNKAKTEGKPLIAEITVENERILEMLCSAYKAQGFYVLKERSPRNNFNYSVIIAESEDAYETWRFKPIYAASGLNLLTMSKKS